MTVKHIESNGYECIRIARCVDFLPAAKNARPATVTAYGVEDTTGGAVKDGVVSYQNGKVYVMDAGKTVADYDLDKANR